MTHDVFCFKLQKEAPGLAKPPYPGPLGERIYQEISKEAWNLWIAHQTLLINEHQLRLNDPKARSFLAQEMEKFLFGEDDSLP